MQAVLVMFRSDGERRSFSITREMTVIGRREDCDMRIPLGEISRKHCRIVRDGDTLKLEDLGSSNGTFLNSRRIQEATLSPGDSIQVGPVVFVLQVDGVPADEELQPVTVDSSALSPFANGGAHALEPTAQSEVGATESTARSDRLSSEDDAFDILNEAGDDSVSNLKFEDLEAEERQT